MSTITATPKKEYFLVSMFAGYFARLYYLEHKDEINSTSPYAVTDKLPKMRVVDNPITKGSWQVSALHSTDHYGIFGGYKGSSVSGGGGGGSIDTKVQFDHISLCPVTGREYTDEELKKYHDDWHYAVERHGRREAEQLTLERELDTNNTRVRYYSAEFRFSQEDLESLHMQYRPSEELVEFINDHKFVAKGSAKP